MTAQEWIDAAIACGRNPLIVPQPNGRHGLVTNCVDVDWERDPGALPDGSGMEVCDLLHTMGRVYPSEVRS